MSGAAPLTAGWKKRRGARFAEGRSGKGEFLRKKADSNHEIEIIAVVGNTVAGTAGIEAVGTKSKVRHRAEFGISVAREFWGLGIGTALMDACIECAGNAGYEQLELNVVAGNTRAVSMYGWL